MLLSHLVCLVSRVPLASAQLSTSMDSSTASSASYDIHIMEPSKTITIKVGQTGHSFDPSVAYADPGDMLMFMFWPKAHSAIKAEFRNPCIPYDTINPGQPSFFSGNFTNPSIQGLEVKHWSWNVTVNDTAPTFYYCGAPDSCLVNHMIGVINPNGTHNLTTQDEFIKNGTASMLLQPGRFFEQEGQTSLTTSFPSVSTVTPSIMASQLPIATTPITPQSPEHHSPSPLSTGAIAGIAIAGAVIVALVGALFWYMGRSRMMKQTLDQQRDPSLFQAPKGGSSMAYAGDSDSRWSASYAGSPAPNERTTQQMETVYNIDRHGSPELEAESVPEIVSVSGYTPRGRRPERLSGASELWSGSHHGRNSRATDNAPPIHEIGQND